ncbi:MAG: hypothetical protein Q9225_003461 [Loekoesia sp. 1 TL-2023]
MRAPYSHVQVVPKLESSVQNENVSPQVTFRKPSYSEEAASSANAASGPLQPKPAASLANMTLGTTFAAKARAAELNAVRNSKAAAKEPEGSQDVTSMAQASVGALKLTKPRPRGKSWKALNLDEIPETSSKVDHPESHHASITRTGTPASLNQNFRQDALSASPQGLYPQVQQLQPRVGLPAQQASYYASGVQQPTAVPRFANEADTQNTFVSPEHFRLQMNHLNQIALQQNYRYVSPGVPTFITTFQAPMRSTPEPSTQQSEVTEDDPFVDLPAGLRQAFHHRDSQPHRQIQAAASSNHGTQSAAQGMMDHEFKFPSQQQQRFSLPHPPGLAQPSVYTHTSPSNQSSVADRQPAPTADTHQRDPKPYTSFTRNSEDSSKKQKTLQHLQQAVDVSKARGNLPSSTRTVLYDPVAQGVSSSTDLHGRDVSQGGDDFLKASEPLPWKNRPVDIYNMLPPASVAPRLHSNEQVSATMANNGEFDGNAYIRSLISEREPAEQRLKSTEAWWKYDGRGQEQARAYLEQVADEHEKKKSGREYESIKRAMERQASFRDEWSDESNAATMPKGPAAGEVINRLMAPVMANLRSYTEENGPSYFNKFSKAPAWAVDSSADGNKSFFGEDWGKPPPRVGRDPRYRPTFHEGRYTVFEPTDGRVSGRGW